MTPPLLETLITTGYDPATEADISALAFRHGDAIIGMLYGEAADYVHGLLRQHLKREGEEPYKRYWLIVYEDASRPNETFTDESTARATYAKRLTNWNCHLFMQVCDNSVALPPKSEQPGELVEARLSIALALQQANSVTPISRVALRAQLNNAMKQIAAYEQFYAGEREGKTEAGRIQPTGDTVPPAPSMGDKPGCVTGVEIKDSPPQGRDYFSSPASRCRTCNGQGYFKGAMTGDWLKCDCLDKACTAHILSLLEKMVNVETVSNMQQAWINKMPTGLDLQPVISYEAMLATLNEALAALKQEIGMNLPLPCVNHKFEPRYDNEPLALDIHGPLNSVATEIHYKQRYVCDICINCGTVRSRP